MSIVRSPGPEPEPDPDRDKSAEDAELDTKLQEHLQRAHEAAEAARESIATVMRELRFPLASSTRVDDRRDG